VDLDGPKELHSVPKNVTTVSHYNSDIHESISIIFGINVGNQKVLYFRVTTLQIEKNP